MLRCMICGRPGNDDPEAATREKLAAEREKETHVHKKPVWICPVCAGKTRFEAEETGHGLKGKQSKPM